jgi:hypothetical protein
MIILKDFFYLKATPITSTPMRSSQLRNISVLGEVTCHVKQGNNVKFCNLSKSKAKLESLNEQKVPEMKKIALGL